MSDMAQVAAVAPFNPNAVVWTREEVIAGLARLREPFEANLISKLPKPTRQQTEAVKKDYKTGIRCNLCGAWHHKDVVHLDYVGHAALTHRLLEVDPFWFWEPKAVDANGLPLFDGDGGLWIKLTVLGVTREGYGNADRKQNQDAGARVKEVIGDALRNAGMRFGLALDLWHKGDLHADGHEQQDPQDRQSGNTRNGNETRRDSGDNQRDRQNGGQSRSTQQSDQRRQLSDWKPNAISELNWLLKATDTDAEIICEYYNADNIHGLSKAQFREAIDRLQNRLAEAAKNETNQQFDRDLDDDINY